MSSASQKRIIVTDDHHIVRKGIIHMIRESFLEVEIFECSNGQETLAQLEKGTYDILLLDVSLPGENGLELFKRIRLLYPSLQVLFVTMFANQEYIKQAISLGASGYIVKDSSIDQLAFALQEILEGRRYFGGDLLLNFFHQGQSSSKECLGKEKFKLLSKREREVFLALAQGRLTKEIAYDLELSSKTISTYRNRILEKLQLRNNAEMVSYAIKENILNP
jgi:DNA-binding NarL/FixJ family response regulator